jgi:hypothetical protein
MKCTTSQGQFLKWSEKHEDLRFVDKSVEIIKQFQHYIGSAGGGGVYHLALKLLVII